MGSLLLARTPECCGKLTSTSKVAVSFFTSLSPIECVLIYALPSPPVLTTLQVTDAHAKPALRKLRNRHNSLKTLPFRGIVFHFVWHQECLSISRTKLRDDTHLKRGS